MAKLDNTKHEAFAQYLSEGHYAIDAHEMAGYKRNRGNATTLASKKHIKARVAELQERQARKADVTKDTATQEIDEAIREAREQGNLSVVATLMQHKHKLHGLMVDKVETRGTTDDHVAAIEELASRKRNRLKVVEGGENKG